MDILTVTETAASKAKELLANSDSPGNALRIRVKDGGCNGMRYELLFDGDAGEQDTEFSQFGLRVLVDGESATYLQGTVVDYSDELNDAGFKIDNPAADGTCGCGESFNV